MSKEEIILNELSDILMERGYNLFFGWSEEHPDIHLTQGMCDDFGCSDTCRDFKSLYEVLEYLRR